jgi:tRNA (guanosine-2'-O-)-methyltransferase
MSRGPLFDAQEFRAGPVFSLGGVDYTAAQVVAGLAPCLSAERQARIAAVAAARTRTIVPVAEGLYDRGNVSAVVRSAEGLGYQAVHVIDNSKHFKEARRVTQGAEKWTDIFEWQDTAPCVAALRAQGYRIAVAHLHDAVPLRELDATVPTALVFGNEHAGPSPEMLAAADLRVIVPMSGFTQSFNISVAAAICLYGLREQRIAQLGQQGDLSAAEQLELTAAFYLRSVPHAEDILARRVF